jgi:hypothetical protein
MDEAGKRYRAALVTHYPGAAGITYAAKAFFCCGACTEPFLQLLSHSFVDQDVAVNGHAEREHKARDAGCGGGNSVWFFEGDHRQVLT